MTPEESDRLRELCMRAQNEMDSVKLVELIQEINRVFEQSEQGKERAQGPPGLDTDAT